MKFTAVPERPELDRLLRESAIRFAAMSPEQKREQFRAQRRSWVIGEMMLEHPEMTREYVERIYDEVEP
jgi:hypothetical protein